MRASLATGTMAATARHGGFAAPLDPLTLLIQVAFYVLFAAALWRYLRRPTPLDLAVVLVFATTAALFAISILNQFAGPDVVALLRPVALTRAHRAAVPDRPADRHDLARPGGGARGSPSAASWCRRWRSSSSARGTFRRSCLLVLYFGDRRGTRRGPVRAAGPSPPRRASGRASSWPGSARRCSDSRSSSPASAAASSNGTSSSPSRSSVAVFALARRARAISPHSFLRAG